MKNLKFNIDIGRENLFKYIPGFRSNKIIKKAISSVYYLFCILMMFMATSISDIFLAIMMIIDFMIICRIIDLFFKKECRNIKSIGKNIVLPFVAMAICASISTSGSDIYNIEKQAAKKLGVSLNEYESAISDYNGMLEKYDQLKENKEANKLEYQTTQENYDSLVKEFEVYKQVVSEESVKELETLKNLNENYKNKISELESEISELEDKLK